MVKASSVWPSGVSPGLRLNFPHERVYSADGSTVALTGHWEGFRLLAVVDLTGLDGLSFPPGNFDHESTSPTRLHLTPDGGELVLYVNEYANPHSYGYWIDLDGNGPALKLGEPIELHHGLSDWADDDRTVLWAGSQSLDVNEFLHVIEIGEAQATSHPVDLQGMSVARSYFHEGGDYLLLTTGTLDSLWGASVVDSEPGPLFPIAGAAAGEDDLIQFVPDTSRTFALLTWEHDDLTRDCEIVMLTDAAFSWTWPLGPCKSASSPLLRAGHLYFSVFEIDNASRVWHLDVTDPFAIPEPISAPNTGSPAVISPAGQWVFQRAGISPQFRIAGLGEPGQSELLTFDGMTANVAPVVIP